MDVKFTVNKLDVKKLQLHFIKTLVLNVLTLSFIFVLLYEPGLLFLFLF